MAERPLTERMVAILRVLAEESPRTPNAIGYALGFRPAPSQGGLGGGRGSGAGTGVAQRVNFPLTALRKRGLVGFGWRPDGLSGTAYSITSDGRAALAELAP